MIKKINIGIIGSGVVGSGVIKILQQKQSLLYKRLGFKLNIKTLCSKNILKKKKQFPNITLSTNYQEIVSDPSIDIVVELIGNTSPAKEIIEQALKKKKHVVTANKALLSQHGKALFKLAKTHQVTLSYEAAIGGGIPIVKTLKEHFASNHIKGLYCIINGTCNYIISKMNLEKESLPSALKKAQSLGFAEQDPSLDISGLDTTQKIALLGQIVFNTSINYQKIFTQGIIKIDPKDIFYTKELGFKIKLLGILKEITNKTIEARVHPTLIPIGNELAQVENEYNAIFIKSDFLDNTLFYGKGAGSLPTASAVISDLVAIGSKLLGAASFSNQIIAFSKKTIVSMKEIMSAYYMRLTVIEKKGILKQITNVFYQNNTSIDTLNQKKKIHHHVAIILTTHQCQEKAFLKILKTITAFSFITEKPTFYRIETLNNP